jgi:hypothetical protein
MDVRGKRIIIVYNSFLPDYGDLVYSLQHITAPRGETESP